MRRKIISILLSTTLLLSACSQSKPSTTINVEMTDFAFTPNQFAVPARAQITLHGIHEGLVEHDFVIMKLNTDAGGHFNQEDLANVFWQVKIQPGDAATFTFTAPGEPGTYQIVCAMAGHVEAGMVGQLEVTVR
jgi:uncharacterized cupredoxin-like copper-binding protein